MKGPRVEKYDCPICAKPIRVSFGSPGEAICTDCKNGFLEAHKHDDLSACPFCNSSDLKHSLNVPYYYGPVGVRVRCNECGAVGGIGAIHEYTDLDKPPLFGKETIENGFAKANAKWNRRAGKSIDSCSKN